MNRNTGLTMALIICAAILVAAAGQALFRVIGSLGYRYHDAGKYTAGEVTIKKPVKNLDIDWADGSVTIAYHAKDTVEITETAPKKLSETESLHWWLDGSTLHIRHTGSGFLTHRSLNKALTVTLPEGSVLESLEISASSADVRVPALQADSIVTDLTSGDLTLVQSGTSRQIELSSTSGEICATLEDGKTLILNSTSGTIDLKQTGTTDKVKLTTTSGQIQLVLEEATALDITSTSGDIRVEGEAVEKAEIGSTSGTISLDLAAFQDLRISATSGDVTLALPSKPGFGAEIETSSGSFDSAIALKREGGDYSCGSGHADLRISTTSGDIRLLEASDG